MIKITQEQLAALQIKAARYDWLRQQHWSSSQLCVVAQPKEAVKLGYDCPSDERLDEMIDREMGKL